MLGISFDAPEENKAFAEAEGFPYPLLSDEDRAVGMAYGAAREPEAQFAGFAKRLSFLIDPEGVVRRTYRVTDPATHPAEVLDDLRQLL